MSEDQRVKQLGEELIARAEQDPSFRRLLADDFEGTVRRATATYFAPDASKELSDQDLEAVAGGAGLQAQARTGDNSSGELANEQMQQMMDIIRDIRDKLASIEQSHAETVKGIARNF